MSEREETSGRTALQRAVEALQEMRARLEVAEAATNEPVDVVSMACRFPGAKDVDAFWKLLRDGAEARREITPDRFAIDEYFDPDPDRAGAIYTRYAALL